MSRDYWSYITNENPGMLRMALQYAAQSLSDLVGRPVKMDRVRVEHTPIMQLNGSTDNLELDSIGVYLRISDDLPGQAVLILSPADAMYWADWLLELRPGTTTILGQLEYSALAETGNLLLSSFLNALAQFTGQSLRLSPPVVRVDVLDTVLEMLADDAAGMTGELMIIKTNFINVESSLLLRFWMLPDPVTRNIDQVTLSRD